MEREDLTIREFCTICALDWIFNNHQGVDFYRWLERRSFSEETSWLPASDCETFEFKGYAIHERYAYLEGCKIKTLLEEIDNLSDFLKWSIGHAEGYGFVKTLKGE